MPTSEMKRYVPLAVWLLAIGTVLIIPLKIIGYGFLPSDDALRHAAKAVSGKTWPEILVMRSDFAVDPNPGWHAILGGMHRLLGGGPEPLVVFSVVVLMLLVSSCVLPWLRRPEAWLATLLAVAIFIPDFIMRLARGRPFIFTDAVLITLLFVWWRQRECRPNPLVVLATLLLMAAAAWIHGSWYLLALLPAAFLVCGLWRSASWLAGCWFTGSYLGALLTGHPLLFLGQGLKHVAGAFGNHGVTRQLVSEFLPADGDQAVVLLVAAMLAWRALSLGWKPQSLLNPAFMMTVLGWLLGLQVLRFWMDWGMPALLIWLALEFQEQFERYAPFDSYNRLLITLGLAAGVFWGTTSDLGSRWTWNLTNQYLTPDKDKPELDSWLPEPNGIIYSTDMRVFYETFYNNPTAPWRYVLGFEPALMLEDDLKVMRKVQWNYGADSAYEPWVKKMRPEDRLVIRPSSRLTGGQPQIKELEWLYFVNDLWVGRLPRATNNPVATPPTN